MVSQIELKDMKFYAYHGVSPQETKVGNTFVVNLILTAPLEKAVISDDLHDTINYAEIFGAVKQEMDIPSKLLEHVAGRIMNALKVKFPQLQEIRLKLSKLNPPFGGNLHSASIILKETF
ncbi:dihydroneopterin aldolase [Parabacteroides chinchillae]|uniref:7,8-dihydroneopterin aldolase n=1 Tax=Parabacteroides chinchillae TaxID=871327 RepID=A0A8G2FBH1_9BACT|nr:dihydroneopterin aldolase [Parabacteroides chinchillae]SEG07385.1 dihydroneopterin aldolase [Parabacteroides chinchillae]